MAIACKHRYPELIAAPIMLLVMTCIVVACTGAPGPEERCGAMASEVPLDGLSVVAAEWIAASQDESTGGALPAHCKLTARVHERTSKVDGRAYAITFEMRFPADWNKRFLYQQNGGNDGRVVPALGELGGGSPGALARGFAVISSDAGHQPTQASDGLLLGVVFGEDPQARLDYGYQATQTLVPIAKRLLEYVYDEPPQYSYMAGCSNGGRHALVGASRFADQFDGFIAGNPGFNLPRAGVQHAWDVQALSTIGPELQTTLLQEEMDLVAAAVVARCDDLDGLADGMVNDLAACQDAFSIHELACSPGQTARCLDPVKVEALDTIFSGPVNGRGEALYSDWPYDAGVNSRNWRGWKVEGFNGGPPIIATMGGGSLAKIFVTPPADIDGSPEAILAYLRSFDFDADAPRIYATDGVFAESAMEFMSPPQAAMMQGLVDNGSKLIVYHGASDGVFSVNDTIDWYEALNANHGGSAEAFARLYVVPGMNHCGGGPATDQFDLLTPMMQWAEQGVAPDRVIASVDPDNGELPAPWSKARTRPLCPWPQQARYIGEGDPERAENFACEQPASPR